MISLLLQFIDFQARSRISDVPVTKDKNSPTEPEKTERLVGLQPDIYFIGTSHFEP